MKKKENLLIATATTKTIKDQAAYGIFSAGASQLDTDTRRLKLRV